MFDVCDTEGRPRATFHQCVLRKDEVYMTAQFASWQSYGVVALLLSLAALTITGCRPITTEATPPAQEAVVAAATPTVTPLPIDATPVAEVATPEATPTKVPPTSLEFEDLGLEIAVVPMGWEVTVQDGQATTRWVVPEDAAGWAVDSASAGAAGNTVVAGSQARGEAVFAPLAAGEITVGQQIIVTGADGMRYLYTVTAVSDPIPVFGATATDEAQAGAYVAPTETGTLTLITGWPLATTTHRVFVVAELAGPAQ